MFVAGPSFHFRLERVRALRERTQQLAEQELASAIRQRSDSQDELRCAEADVERAQGEQRTAAGSSQTLSAHELLAHQAFLERVEAKRGESARDLEQRDADVARRDEQLASAARDHQMLARLRDRHRGEHDREEASREQRTLDEIASVRFRRSAA